METYDELRDQRDKAQMQRNRQAGIAADLASKRAQDKRRIQELEDEVKKLNGLRWVGGLRHDEVEAEVKTLRDLASGLQNQLDEAMARLKDAVAERDEAQRRLETVLAQRDEHDVRAQTLMQVVRLLIAGRA